MSLIKMRIDQLVVGDQTLAVVAYAQWEPNAPNKITWFDNNNNPVATFLQDIKATGKIMPLNNTFPYQLVINVSGQSKANFINWIKFISHKNVNAPGSEMVVILRLSGWSNFYN